MFLFDASLKLFRGAMIDWANGFVSVGALQHAIDKTVIDERIECTIWASALHTFSIRFHLLLLLQSAVKSFRQFAIIPCCNLRNIVSNVSCMWSYRVCSRSPGAITCEHTKCGVRSRIFSHATCDAKISGNEKKRGFKSCTTVDAYLKFKCEDSIKVSSCISSSRTRFCISPNSRDDRNTCRQSEAKNRFQSSVPNISISHPEVSFIFASIHFVWLRMKLLLILLPIFSIQLSSAFCLPKTYFAFKLNTFISNNECELFFDSIGPKSVVSSSSLSSRFR